MPTETIQTRWSVAAAALFGAAAAVWSLAGPLLPGGRWLAIHFITLGVASNLLNGFMPYFARTLLHAPFDDRAATPRLVLLNAGTLLVVVGLPSGIPAMVAVGATSASAAVFLLWRALRQTRKRALPSRFVFVVRVYERACGAFLHGALLGALLGTGVIAGGWFGGVRLAHLHVNLLGWVGLPLLATLVTLGPTVMRTRMAVGAAERAAAGLSRAATALTVAVLALAFSGAPGMAGRLLELVAAGGLVVYGWGVLAVCVPVLTVWPKRVPSLGATLLAGSCVWFLLAVAGDVAVVATGAFSWLDVLGPAFLGGALLQAVFGALLHLLPTVVPASAARRATLRGRLAALPSGPGVTLNVGVALLTLVPVGVRVSGLG